MTPRKTTKTKTKARRPRPKSISTTLDSAFCPCPCLPGVIPQLQPGKPGIVFVVETPEPHAGGDDGATIQRFDLNKRKGDVALRNVREFTVSFNGEKMLYQQGDKWTISDSRGQFRPPKELKTSDLEVSVDPAAEWKQMYPRSMADRAGLLLRSAITTASICRPPKRATAYTCRASPRATI